MHLCPLSHTYQQLFVKATFSNFTIFMVKNTFEPIVLKIGYKNKFHQFKSFCPSNYQCYPLQFSKGMVHIWFKIKMFEKNKNYALSKFECFEHAKTFMI